MLQLYTVKFGHIFRTGQYFKRLKTVKFGHIVQTYQFTHAMYGLFGELYSRLAGFF